MPVNGTLATFELFMVKLAIHDNLYKRERQGQGPGTAIDRVKRTVVLKS